MDSQTINTLKSDNEQLIKENISLKHQIGGYKTQNQRFKNQEATYTNIIEEKDKVITALEAQITQMSHNMSQSNNQLRKERDIAMRKYRYVCNLPWYKRMFYSEE